MSKLPVKILGTGIYLPPNLVTSEKLEEELGYAQGTFEKASGVKRRFYARGESSSSMGSKAAKKALEAAGLTGDDIDAVIAVGGVPQQAIPSTAALIHNQLGLKSGVAFDINATCLSFITGFHCMGSLIAKGIYKRVLLVAADVASVGLDPKDPKTASLFGDGAAACVLGLAEQGGILDVQMETKSQFSDTCECKGGGTLLAQQEEVASDAHYFRMNGPKLYKAALPYLFKMVRSLTSKSDKEIDLYIPHQASPMALDRFQAKMGLRDDQIMHIVRDYGNMIATSLPFALHLAIEQKKLKRGDRVLLFGTAAGLTLGGLLLEY